MDMWRKQSGVNREMSHFQIFKVLKSFKIKKMHQIAEF